MTRRHVRAVAVFLIVLVTLTGARRSGGGSCDDDNDNSSSSTSGGFVSGGSEGSSSGDDIDIPDMPTMPTIEPPSLPPIPTDTPDIPDYPSYTPEPEVTTDDPEALDEVDVTSCDYDENTQELFTDLRINNSADSGAYDYTIQVKIEQTKNGSTTGNVMATETVTVRSLSAGGAKDARAEAYYPLKEYTTFECSVTSAKKYPSL